MRILLVGCSGFVGRGLVPMLLEQGHSLTLVSRSPRPLPSLDHPQLQRLQADPAQAASWQRADLQAALAGADAVVNLAGEPIAEKRWTPAHRQLLRDSRIHTTAALVAALAALPEGQRPGVLINGSAVGYYGTSDQERFEESSPAGDDVLGHLCADWEAAARAAEPLCRVVILRIGIVLAALIQQLTAYFTETNRRPVDDVANVATSFPGFAALANAIGLSIVESEATTR